MRLSERPLIAKIGENTNKSFIGIAGLKGGFGDIAASVDTLTSNTARTDDDIQSRSWTTPNPRSRATSTSTPSKRSGIHLQSTSERANPLTTQQKATVLALTPATWPLLS